MSSFGCKVDCSACKSIVAILKKSYFLVSMLINKVPIPCQWRKRRNSVVFVLVAVVGALQGVERMSKFNHANLKGVFFIDTVTYDIF